MNGWLSGRSWSRKSVEPGPALTAALAAWAAANCGAGTAERVGRTGGVGGGFGACAACAVGTCKLGGGVTAGAGVVAVWLGPGLPGGGAPGSFLMSQP